MSDTIEADDLFDAGSTRGHADGCIVVGIGASAGGVEALKTFFGQVRAGSGMAYVVILHLSPDHESKLAEILQSAAAIPVTQVRERTRVQPDHVYVISPHQSLTLEHGHLAVSETTDFAERRAPIDIFFRTLAESHQTDAVCVVLSGTGADGSMGLKRVKEFGGICIVQDPAEAAYGDMPRHAVETKLVDDVLPVAQIPAKIAAYKHYRAIVRIPLEERSVADERALIDIYSRLRVSTGHDFTNYKRATVLRRIERRMNVHELTDLTVYAQLVCDKPEEAQALLKDLLISVTNFFRDAEAFLALERDIIPRLFADKGKHDHVRVWVSGCATGEEAYTIAMLLAEHAAGNGNAPHVQVFATDIDEWALAKARAGIYTLNDAADVTPERLRRFFLKENGSYRVRPELREMVLFALHNVIRHPPFSHVDLITCRNLLIYLDSTAQRRLMEIFHFALNPSGYLFLGTSESVDGAGNFFAAVDKDAHVYQCRAVTPRAPVSFTSAGAPPALPSLPLREELPLAALVRPRITYPDLHQRLLEQYAPPSVLVTDDYKVVHLSATAGHYMQVRGGEPSNDLLNMVHPDLRLELRSGFYHAARDRTNVEVQGVQFQRGADQEQVNIHVRPVLRDDEGASGFFLVLFEPAAARQERNVQRHAAGADPLVEQLEDDLIDAKTRLRASTEQHELQEEELRASNEELQSMNEELRSTTEELETGREELQSVNEELTTVNQELKIKIEELTQAGNDARNLMNSTQIGTVFLDRRLRVKLFTPSARDVFNLISSDVGRPLLDITHNLQYDELLADIEVVLDSLRVCEREVSSSHGRWYIARVVPYRTGDDRIDGLVLTFTDITARKDAEDALRATEKQFRCAIEDAPIPVIMYAEDGAVLEISRLWTEYTGYTMRDVPDFETWLARASGEGAAALLAHMADLYSGARPTLQVEFSFRTRENEERHWSFSVASPGRLRDGRRYLVGMAVDLTERKRGEEALRRGQERLRLAVESVSDYSIFTTDAAGIIETWNSGAANIFGYSESEAVGMSADVVFTPEDRVAGAPDEERRVARETGRAADERWHMRKNGERFYASGVLAQMADGEKLIGYTKIAQDLTSRRVAEAQLLEAREELERRVLERTAELAQANETLRREVIERKQSEEMRVRLLGLLVEAQENERKRISRELHDQFGQQVTALRMKLSALKAAPGAVPAVGEELTQLENLARELDADIDYLVWELRPTALDDLGLVAALNEYVTGWSKLFGVPVRITSPGMTGERLTSEIETVLYRVTQEALNNIGKHARATRVDIILERRADHVSLIIEDDGIGFDAEELARTPSKGLGLVGMRERVALAGGSVAIEPTPGRGVTIFVRIPPGMPDRDTPVLGNRSRAD